MDEKVQKAALRLALQFTEPKDIPAQYKGKKKKEGEDTKLEERFNLKLAVWLNLIEVLLLKVQPQQAWRFINIKPKTNGREQSVVHCPDFLDFTEYFILRRDIESCGPDELGNIALLHDAFQKQIEGRVGA